MTQADPSVLRRKLAVIVENLKALERVGSMSVQQYRDDLFVRKGTERLLQELIEAAIDINTHILVQDGQGFQTTTTRVFSSWPTIVCFSDNWRKRWHHLQG